MTGHLKADAVIWSVQYDNFLRGVVWRLMRMIKDDFFEHQQIRVLIFPKLWDNLK